MTKPNFDDYRSLHAELARVLATASDADLDRKCRACPDWTVRQLVGHMVHTLGSADTGGLPLKAIRDAVRSNDRNERAAAARSRDEWTHAGATRLGALPFDELMARWDRLVTTDPSAGLVLVPDVAVHLDDITETLGFDTGSRHHLMLGLGPYSSAHRAALQARGLPSVRLVCTDGDESFGDHEAEHTVLGKAYDLCRVMMGRRSPDEADAVVDWGPESGEIRDSFPLYGLERWQRAL